MTERKIIVEQVVNGYVVTTFPSSGAERSVFKSLDEVLAILLQRFEHRYQGMHGEHYGRVVVVREEPGDDAQEMMDTAARRAATDCAHCHKPVGSPYEEYGRDGKYWGKYHPICLQIVRSGKGEAP